MGQVLVLDLDETLIANSFLEARPSSKIRVVEIPTPTGFVDSVILRPYAHDFLLWCRAHFPHIILATFSSEFRATVVSDRVGIRPYFDAIVHRDFLEFAQGNLFYGGEPSRSYDLGGDFCLVDDQSWNSRHVLSKMNCFGIDVRPVVSAKRAGTPLDYYREIDDRFIQAPEYLGNPDDTFLSDLLESFKENYTPDEAMTA